MTTLCGRGYAGFACRLCAAGFFPAEDGTCTSCPPSMLPALLATGVPFALVTLCTCVAVFLILLWYDYKTWRMQVDVSAMSVARRATFLGSPWHRWRRFVREFEITAVDQALNFGIWLLIAVQTLATAASSPAPGLPRWIRAVYRTLALYNMDTEYVEHRGCGGSSAFRLPMTIHAVALSACASLGLLSIVMRAGYAPRAPLGRKIYSGLQRGMHMMVAVMFPVVARHAFQLLHCVPALGQDAGSGSGSGSGSGDSGGGETPLVLEGALAITHFENATGVQSREPIPCWGELHAPAGAIAWVALLVVVVGYPVATLVHLLRLLLKEKLIKSTFHSLRWGFFVQDDYIARFFWFRHLNWGTMALMLLLQTYVGLGPARGVPVILVLLVQGGLIAYLRPFVQGREWLGYVKMAIIACSILATVCDIMLWAHGIEVRDSSEEHLTTSSGITIMAVVLFASCISVLLVLPISLFCVLRSYHRLRHAEKQAAGGGAALSPRAVELAVAVGANAIEDADMHEEVGTFVGLGAKQYAGPQETPMIAPDGSLWNRYYDENSGEFYYWNGGDKTCWDMPEGLMPLETS